MAEAFARHYGAGRVEAHSAGMEPTRLKPDAVTAMREAGIDISRQQPKTFDETLARRMDDVVTVCGNAHERCPVLPPEVRRLHWPLDDPARSCGTPEEILAVFRRSRDGIETRVRDFIAQITAADSGRRPGSRPACKAIRQA